MTATQSLKTIAVLAVIAMLAGSASAANLAWSGGNGTWQDGTQANFDATWNNANPDSADFQGSAGTVSVSGSIDLLNLHFTTNSGYLIQNGTLNFAAGGVISNSYNSANNTIASTITGSPAVNTYDGPNQGYLGLKFAPTGGATQTLGVITNPIDIGNRDKAGVVLAGDTTGNTVQEITYAATGNSRYGRVWKEDSGTWTVNGNLKTGIVSISGGRLAVNGNVQTDYQGLLMSGTGVLAGNASVYKGDRRAANNFVSGTGIAPGNSIGTISFDWGTGGGPNANQWVTAFRAGSFYEWEVGAGNITDLVTIVDGRLIVEGFTLKIIDAGGSPDALDQLPVFTYGTLDSKTLALGSVVFDTSMAPLYDASGASLVDDGNGTVYLTGLALIPEPASLALLGLGGLLIAGRRR
jgi:hypothetical protein